MSTSSSTVDEKAQVPSIALGRIVIEDTADLGEVTRRGRVDHTMKPKGVAQHVRACRIFLLLKLADEFLCEVCVKTKHDRPEAEVSLGPVRS